MFSSFLAKIFTALVAQITLSGITILPCAARKQGRKFVNFLFEVFLKMVSSFIFHIKKSRVLGDAVCGIFAIEKCICSKRQRDLLLT